MACQVIQVIEMKTGPVLKYEFLPFSREHFLPHHPSDWNPQQYWEPGLHMDVNIMPLGIV